MIVNTMNSKNSSSNAPRKFSEKIALLKQKEAEITASYEIVMRDVHDISETDRSTDSPDFSPGNDSEIGATAASSQYQYDSSSSPITSIDNMMTSYPQQRVSSRPLLQSASLPFPSGGTTSSLVRTDSFGHPINHHQQQQLGVMTSMGTPSPSMPPSSSNIRPQQVSHGHPLPTIKTEPSSQFYRHYNVSPGGGDMTTAPAHTLPFRPAHLLAQTDGYGASRTASLPNVSVLGNHAPGSPIDPSGNNGSIDLQSALHNLERMKSGREMLADHLKSRHTKHHSIHNPQSMYPFGTNPGSTTCPQQQDDPANNGSPQHSPRHHHGYGRTDPYHFHPHSGHHNRSPYASPYLTPPPPSSSAVNTNNSSSNCGPNGSKLPTMGSSITFGGQQQSLLDNCRRTASDSAIHQSLLDQLGGPHPIGGFSHPTGPSPLASPGGMSNNIGHQRQNYGPPLVHQHSQPQQPPPLSHMGWRQTHSLDYSSPASVTTPQQHSGSCLSDLLTNTNNNRNMLPTLTPSNMGRGPVMSSCPASPLAAVQHQLESFKMCDGPSSQAPRCASFQSRTMVEASGPILPPSNYHQPPSLISTMYQNNQPYPPPPDTNSDLVNQIPDIVLTEPEVERRDSFTTTTEFLSKLGGGGGAVAPIIGGVACVDMIDTDMSSLLEISDNDLHILTDPSMIDYVTDDFTEEELLQEHQHQ